MYNIEHPPPARHGTGARYWRRRCADLTDADLAAELRERFHWRDAQLAELPAWVREWSEAGHTNAAWYTAHWDGGVAWAFEAITMPLIEEAIRRLSRRSTGRQAHLTTAQLLAAFGDRLQPAGEGRWRARCPWHEDSRPSLVIFERAWVHCFSCGAHHPVGDLAAAWRAEVAA